MAKWRILALAWMAALLVGEASARGGEPPPAEPKPTAPPPATEAEIKAKKQERRPEFHILFSFGYGSEDGFPNPDDAKTGEEKAKARATFDAWIQRIADGSFTAVMCTYAPWKEEICRKHKVKMLLNLVSHRYHHVYKNTDRTAAILGKLRGNDAILGYHLWSDTMANRRVRHGRVRDTKNCHGWDPTHATFVGTYRTYGIHYIHNSDSIGFYDFHWSRGRAGHFPNLMRLLSLAQKFDSRVHRWMEISAGQPGKGNPDRCGYTAATSLACGVKGLWWFLGSSLMKDGEWTPHGRDICAVNARFVKLGPEITKIGNPVAVYSTPQTKSMGNKPMEKTAIPPGLKAIPDDFWAKVTGGEAVVGVYKHPDQSDVLFFANHNAHEPQKMVVEIKNAKSVELLDRATGTYKALERAKGEAPAVTFEMPAGCCELLKVKK
jgi:hypothetical protein